MKKIKWISSISEGEAVGDLIVRKRGRVVVWYIAWKDHNPPLKTAQCQLWDETNQKCLRNEKCDKQWEKKNG